MERERLNDLIGAFAEGLLEILGDRLYGAYIHGAVAFGDDIPTGDLDFHVVLTRPLDDATRSRLCDLHDSLARDFPPLGVGMDGYYILLDDARGTKPPESQMWQRAKDLSWALHRRHMRAGRVIVLHGPQPGDVFPPATWPEIEMALEGELGYVRRHLEEYPHYSVLQLCRLVYSFETRDAVVSKARAARWATGALPNWRRYVKLAVKMYEGLAGEGERSAILEGIAELLEEAEQRISCARGRSSPWNPGEDQQQKGDAGNGRE